MSALSVTAVLALANACVGPSLGPVMVGIAQHESALDPAAVHRNANGTVDVGLAQVNSANFAWLGLTMQTALDPCRNLAAGARVLLVRYNGNPPDTGKVAYAASVTASIRALDGAIPVTGTPSPPPPCAPAWDAWGLAACSNPTGTHNQSAIAQETTHAN